MDNKEVQKNVDINLDTNLDNEVGTKLQWIDTHSHYNLRQFKKNQKELLTKLHDTNTKYIMQLGTNMNTNQDTLVLCSLYDFIYGMIGFFPTDVYELEPTLCEDAETNLLVFSKQLMNQKVMGIGEIGLDYHWDCVGPRGKELKGNDAREIQKKWFRYQLNLAKEMKLPVSMHSRDAERDTLEIFNEFDSIEGVMHCFSYGLESAKAYLDKGLYLGFGGTSTYPRNKELREVIKMCPMDRILLETDAPYLSPQPVRRETNTSDNIKYVIENIANIKGISFEDVVRITNENAIRLLKFETKVIVVGRRK